MSWILSSFNSEYPFLYPYKKVAELKRKLARIIKEVTIKIKRYPFNLNEDDLFSQI